MLSLSSMGVSSMVAFSSSIFFFSSAAEPCTYCCISFVFALSSSFVSACILGYSAFTVSTMGWISFMSLDDLLPNRDCMNDVKLICVFR